MQLKDFYMDTSEFVDLLMNAYQGATTDRQIDFVADIQSRLDKYGDGMYITETQINYLEKLAK